MSSSVRPIFILGMTRRTGTNFLFKLLGLHPGIALGERLPEDFLLEYSHLIETYARKTVRHWHSNWGSCADQKEGLMRAIGSGLERFLTENALVDFHGAKRPVFKTPSIANVERLRTLFPEASLLLLTRDGRDTVQSGIASFGWRFERSVRDWTKAGKAVIEFSRSMPPNSDFYKVVRFEDLVLKTQTTMQEVLSFLGLDEGAFDFEAASCLPLYGSSTLREGIHWHPKNKPSTFNPIGRWHVWSESESERFAWIASKVMTQLSYDGVRAPAGYRATLGHYLLDARYFGGIALRRAHAALLRGGYSVLQALRKRRKTPAEG